MIFDLNNEPKQQTYNKLIDYCISNCSFFSFVIRNDETLTDTCLQIVSKFNPYLATQFMTQQWPGTILLSDQTATLFKYRLNPESGELLKNVASRLYQWLHPDLPEDLSFYKTKDTV